MSKVKTAGKLSAAAAAAAKERKPHSFDGEVSSGSKLLAAITTMGLDYDPANVNITKAAINIKQTSITALNNATVSSYASEKLALLGRQGAYDFMSVLKTDSLNAFKSSDGVTPAQVVIATNMGKRVDGIRIKTIKIAPVPPVTDAIVEVNKEAEIIAIRRNTVSHQQFGIRMGSFFTYITYICAQSCYVTNVTRLMPLQLTAYYDSLAVLNSAAESATFATDEARKARNIGFFDNTTGARFLYTQVKKYVASTFGTKSAEYKMIKGLPFPNLISKKNRTPDTSY